MAVVGTSVPTLLDIATAMGPNGTFDTERVNLLKQTNEMIEDMVWREGNLPTGNTTTIVTGLPSVQFRRINEGVALSKSTGAKIEDSAAMLEGFFQVDRALAVMSGDANKYRFEESNLFLESMNQTMQAYSLYGNAAVLPESFTGIATRMNALSTGRVIDAGGSSTDNTSIYLAAWGPSTMFGMFPKGSVGGLTHTDVTQNKSALPGTSVNGAIVGDVLLDPNGKPYMGYRDHFSWNCGIVVRNHLAMARAANIDVSDLIAENVSAADIVKLMIKLTYMIPTHMRKNRGAEGAYRPAFYVNSTVKAMLHLQALNSVKGGGGLTYQNIGGQEVLSLLGIPVREVDQILNTEARVV